MKIVRFDFKFSTQRNKDKEGTEDLIRKFTAVCYNQNFLLLLFWQGYNEKSNNF